MKGFHIRASASVSASLLWAMLLWMLLAMSLTSEASGGESRYYVGVDTAPQTGGCWDEELLAAEYACEGSLEVGIYGGWFRRWGFEGRGLGVFGGLEGGLRMRPGGVSWTTPEELSAEADDSNQDVFVPTSDREANADGLGLYGALVFGASWGGREPGDYGWMLIGKLGSGKKDDGWEDVSYRRTVGTGDEEEEEFRDAPRARGLSGAYSFVGVGLTRVFSGGSEMVVVLGWESWEDESSALLQLGWEF